MLDFNPVRTGYSKFPNHIDTDSPSSGEGGNSKELGGARKKGAQSKKDIVPSSGVTKKTELAGSVDKTAAPNIKARSVASSAQSAGDELQVFIAKAD